MGGHGPLHWPELAACADPQRARLGLERLFEGEPELAGRLEADAALRADVVTAMAAGPFLTRICTTVPGAVDVLSRGGSPVAPLRPLARWKALEVLRIATLDLSGRTALEQVGRSLADLADNLLQAAAEPALALGALAVIGMGKLGAQELNYGSDIDLVLVGEVPLAAAQRFVEEARTAWRTDLDLRPEGRAGPLLRSLPSYEAYWDRWAQTWEFQALLKVRPVAGDAELGGRFVRSAGERVWQRPLEADDLRALRDMKARAEQILGRKGMAERELKRGPGGIRDIEFAVQLLQLVHGRSDPALRAPATLDALVALAAGGYVSQRDADTLADAYRFLRTVEHRLQLFDDRQVHSLPGARPALAHLARVMGYRDNASLTALAQFEYALTLHQAEARAAHERIFFRPLLEAFTGLPRWPGFEEHQAGGPPVEERTGEEHPGLPPAPAGPGGGAQGPGAEQGPPLAPAAVEARLAAFGFSDARRTRAAVVELTQGLSRSSRLMQQMVPLLLDWLSSSPDPDLGLLGLRRLATGQHRRGQLVSLFRDSPEAARRACLLLGTGPGFAEGYEHHPDQLALLGDGPPPLPSAGDLERRAADNIAWRQPEQWWRGLSRLVQSELLRTQARDVLGIDDVAATARSVTNLAEAVLSVCTRTVVTGREGLSSDDLPVVEGLAVVAMGRFGGADLAYASDLDVMVVFDDRTLSAHRAERAAEELVALVHGDTPVHRLYDLDLSLRPEGRQGPLARSLKAFEAYYSRWAQVWERQALTRGRFVAGDPDVGQRFAHLAREFVWGRPFDEGDVREVRRLKARVERERVPPGEDPAFHLKLGPGSLSDVEWTVQLLQLRSSVPAEGTLEALRALSAAGVVDPADAEVLASSYRFCEEARNRLYLVRGRAGNSLPPPGHQLTTLARSLGTTAPELRERYRMVTRRARRVTERLFYGAPGS